jgi:hypothetical protein
MVYCRRLIVKNCHGNCFARSQSFKKNSFVASMIGSQAERFLATKQVTDHPARRENRCAPRSILPAFELETPSDLCDTKF